MSASSCQYKRSVCQNPKLFPENVYVHFDGKRGQTTDDFIVWPYSFVTQKSTGFRTRMAALTNVPNSLYGEKTAMGDAAEGPKVQR